MPSMRPPDLLELRRPDGSRLMLKVKGMSIWIGSRIEGLYCGARGPRLLYATINEAELLTAAKRMTGRNDPEAAELKPGLLSSHEVQGKMRFPDSKTLVNMSDDPTMAYGTLAQSANSWTVTIIFHQ